MFLAAMLSPAVLTRLLALLKCPAWPIQKSTLEILQSAVLHLPPDDVTDLAMYATPHILGFYNGLSNPCNAWPDQSQHAHTAKLIYFIVSIQPVESTCLQTFPAEHHLTTAPDSCGKACHNKVDSNCSAHAISAKVSGKGQSGAAAPETAPMSQQQMNPVLSLQMAWDIVRHLILSRYPFCLL